MASHLYHGTLDGNVSISWPCHEGRDQARTPDYLSVTLWHSTVGHLSNRTLIPRLSCQRGEQRLTDQVFSRVCSCCRWSYSAHSTHHLPYSRVFGLHVLQSLHSRKIPHTSSQKYSRKVMSRIVRTVCLDAYQTWDGWLHAARTRFVVQHSKNFSPSRAWIFCCCEGRY